jgi:hypothetical protein
MEAGNMSVENVQKAIAGIAKSGQNDLLIIRGAWGVGKTYFWEHLISRLREEKAIALSSYAYVSLFGVNDIETVKNQISASLLLNKLTSSADQKRGWRAFLQSDAIKDAQKAAEQLPYIKWLPIGLANEAAFMLAKDSIICIDDIERKGSKLAMKEVLGLAALLKEQRHCKVVFILNEDNLTPEEKKEFDSYNEKLVDWSFDFAPSADSVFDFVFPSGSADREFIRNLSLRLRIRNIRVLKRISSFLELLAVHVADLPDNIRLDAVRSLIVYVWCAYDRENERPTFEFLENYTSFLFDIGQKKGEPEELQRERKFHDLLSQLPYETTDEVDKELIKFVRTGVLDEETFNLVMNEKVSNRKKAEEEQGYREAWDLYRHRFGNNEEEFLVSLRTSFYTNLERLGISDLQGVVEVLRYFDMPEEATKMITDFVAARITPDNIDEWKTWKMLSSVTTDEEITSQMALVEEKRPVRIIPFAEAIRRVSGRMPNDFFGDEIEVMRKASADEYYNYFKSYSDEGLYYVVDACLKLPESRSQTIEALRRIKQQSRIDELRVTRMYQLDQYEKIKNLTLENGEKPTSTDSKGEN